MSDTAIRVDHPCPESGRRMSQLYEAYRETALGWKLSGAGGGGYLVLVADRPVAGTIRPRARRALE